MSSVLAWGLVLKKMIVSSEAFTFENPLTGGVFNSPEANNYWARRFGNGFGGFTGLRALQVIYKMRPCNGGGR